MIEAHTLATAMQKSLIRWKRKPADFYPTPYNVTVALLDFLNLNELDSIWEPAAGDGDMVLPIVAMLKNHVVATDLRPTPFIDVYGQTEDFVNFEVNPLMVGKRRAIQWVITNPPFSLAEQFIEKALEVAPNVAMLVRSQYWHAATRLPMFERNRPSYILPLTWRPAFELSRGDSPLMDVSWVVWQKKDSPNKDEHPHFIPLVRPTAARMAPIAKFCDNFKSEYGLWPSRLELFIRSFLT